MQMKKNLFCAGILALAASCAENEIDSISGQKEATKGISFEGALVETPTTRGDLAYDDVSGIHNFFWYAETDKISIWSTNTKGATNSNNSTAWDNTKVVKYKATQSKANGVFTAYQDDNILDFQYGPGEKDWADPSNEQYKSQFIVTYPSTVSFEKEKATGVYEFSALPELTNQNQQTLDGKDVTEKIMMLSLTKAVKENSYDAVGEKIDLKFVRPFTAVVFRTQGVDEEYANIFGALQSIKLEAKGYDENKDGDTDDAEDINPSYLDYGSTAHYLYNSEKPEESKLVKADGNDIVDMGTEVTGAATSITLQLNGATGLDFVDGNLAYMAINKVDRKAFQEANVKETMAMTFTFKNIVLSKTVETSTNWPSTMNNKFIGGDATTLDINDFNYLVTNNNSNDRTLIVNKGTFSQIFNENGKVMWNNAPCEPTEFEKIISKVELTADELTTLVSFTNAKSITLTENTTIPAATFKNLASLETINLPKVTTIAKDAFEGTTLKNVILPAYKFADETINPIILNAALETLDMSGVDQMSAAFPGKGLNLSGYTNLEEVTVKDGLLVGASSFNGCSALTTINGAIEFREDGAAAFKGCTALTEINIKNTVIPADAFSGCTNLTDILKDGEQVQPTSVGSQAFLNCTSLKIMDLSLTTTLGQQAFKGCVALYGIDDATEDNKKILHVGAATIPFEAFENCTALRYVNFMEATSFDEDILKNCSGGVGEAYLKEIKFKQAFTIASGISSLNTFGSDTKYVKLFINPNQDVRTFTDNTLKLNATNITFLSITKE